MQDLYDSPDFETLYSYTGSDLGLTLTPDAVFFRLWAPTAAAVSVRLYEGGTAADADLILEAPMERDVQGTWVARISGNWCGRYYTYAVSHGDQIFEVCDPYALSVGVNAGRAMILDMRSTDPEDWEKDADPNEARPLTDAIICEVHVRDFSIDHISHIHAKGKYLGLTESSSLPNGMPTGINHLVGLGVTHVQLQPVFDFGSVDESHPEQKQYNWGYDPMHYNVPEGSYATDPFHGEIRVKELKQMVKALHDHGISVIMDVVYNHVYKADTFCINQIVPGYFSRPGANGSGCGNDTASERPMVRKYIIDSLCHWVKEYHIDGFRFDLAGLIDVQTIRDAMEAVKRIRPNIHFYGEGWAMDTRPTKPGLAMVNQQNSAIVPEFAFFNDTTRDLLRGSVFDGSAAGFVSGSLENKDSLHACFMGVTPWACSPEQSINYVSCHDNHTLFDKLSLALPQADMEELILRSRMAAAFVMLSQGVPFFLLGEELLRSKPIGKGKFESNSYRSADKVNSLKWRHLKEEVYLDNVRYYQGLIAFRKAHPSLRLRTREEVFRSVRPLPCPNPHTVAFRIRSEQERILVIFHAGMEPADFALPDGDWKLCIDHKTAGIEPLANMAGTIVLNPLSTTVLVQEKPTQVKDVVAALIWRGDRFLICQRPAHKARGLLWEFVGGKRESGESKEAALIRECQEELAVTVEVGSVYTEVLHRYPDIHIRLTLFNCTLPEGEPAKLEHNDLRWITPDEIPQYQFCPADKDILAMLQGICE